jgi:GT2 family glycosyltransferase
MLKNKELSIIIVNYKSWLVLERCLESFRLYRPVANYEIIVVDNDSQDENLPIFKSKFTDVTFIKNSGNYGFSNGCNLGAKYATGKFLLFLNPDIILTNPNSIDKMLNFAVTHPDVGITTCRKITPKGKSEREITFFNSWLTIGIVRTLYKFIFKAHLATKFSENADIWYPDWTAGSVVLIQAGLFKQIGQWADNLYWMYYKDVDLCKKIHDTGKQVALLRKVELQHAHGGASRRTASTAAITKSEVVCSSHVFIQNNEKGVIRVLLHSVICTNTIVSQLLKVLLTLPTFWRPAFKISTFTFISTLKYYLNALQRKSWLSMRLPLNNHSH